MEELFSLAVDEWERRKDQLERSISDLHLQRKELSRKYSHELKNYHLLSKKTSELDGHIVKLNNIKEQLQKQAEDLSYHSQAVMQQKKEISEQKNKTEALLHQLSLKNNQASEFNEHLRQLERDLEKKEKEIQAKQQEFMQQTAEARKSLLQADRKQDEIRRKEEELKASSAKLQSQLQEIQRLKSDVLKQVAQFNKEKEAFNHVARQRESKLNEIERSLKSRHDAIESQSSELQQKQQQFLTTKQQFEQDAHKVRPFLNKMLENERTLYDLQHKVKLLSADVKHFEARKVESVKELDNVQQQIAKQQGVVDDLNLKIHGAQLVLRRIKTEIETLEAHGKLVEKQLADRQERMNKFEKEILQRDLDIRAQLEQVHLQNFRAQQELVKAKASAEVVAEREKLLSQKEAELHKWDTALKNEQVRHTKIREDLRGVEDRLRNVELRELEISKRQDALAVLEAETQKKKADVLAIERDSDVMKMRGQISKLQNDLNEQTQKNLQAQSVIDDSKRKLDLLAAENKKLSDERAQTLALQADMARMKDELTVTKADNVRLAKQLGDAKSIDADPDVALSLAALDKLMEHLPEEVLNTFVNSQQFKTVEKVFTKYNIGHHE